MLAGVTVTANLKTFEDEGGYDACVPCELSTYRDTDGWPREYHKFAVCSPCTTGLVTFAEGSVAKTQCQKPGVVTFRSTHRIYYWFNEALLAQSTCMRTSISARDLSNSKGIPAVRMEPFSPACPVPAASSDPSDPASYVSLSTAVSPHATTFSCAHAFSVL